MSAYEAGLAMRVRRASLADRSLWFTLVTGGTEDSSAIYEFTMGDDGKERELNSIGDRR